MTPISIIRIRSVLLNEAMIRPSTGSAGSVVAQARRLLHRAIVGAKLNFAEASN